METHAVPQHIQSYQFHLVGDMTLKQFSELAAGIVTSLLIYNLPIYWFIKWPIIIFCVLLGVALAFVPIEERPLETWIAAFFRAIYAPTQYFWKKSAIPPEILTQPLEMKALPAIEIIAPQGQEKLQEYLKSLPETQVTPEDPNQKSRLDQITQLFQTTPVPISATPSRPQPAQAQPEPAKEPSLEVHPLSPPETVTPFIHHEIPETVVIEPTQIEPLVPATPNPPPPEDTSFSQPQVTKTATYSLDIPIPTVPTNPNLVVGMVVTDGGKIVENAILEIRESGSGHPVRAMKTNKIGQFSIITALKDGSYDIITEKEGLAFDPVRFDAKGEIIPPIEIRAKSDAGPNPI